MIVATARITVEIPSSRSLKDKRQVIRSLLAQVRNEFHVAAAEVDQLDSHRLAVLGLAAVSTDGRHADEVIAKAVRFLESRMFDATMIGFETELLYPF